MLLSIVGSIINPMDPWDWWIILYSVVSVRTIDQTKGHNSFYPSCILSFSFRVEIETSYFLCTIGDSMTSLHRKYKILIFLIFSIRSCT